MSNRPLFQTTSQAFPKYQEAELSSWLRDMFGEGILSDVGEQFALSIGSGSVTVGTGVGIVDGYFCPSRTPTTKGIGTPSATTRHRLVLRHDASNKTSTVELLVGVNGAPDPPNWSVVPGGVYDVPLWQLVVQPSGAITAVDERKWAYYHTRHVAKEYAAGSITPAALDRVYTTLAETRRTLQITQSFMQRQVMPATASGIMYLGVLDNAVPRYFNQALIGVRVSDLNDANNHWEIRFELVGGSDQGTPWMFNTAAQNPGQWYRFNPQAHIPGFAYPIPAGNNLFVQLIGTRVGNPGPLELIPEFTYRLVS